MTYSLAKAPSYTAMTLRRVLLLLGVLLPGLMRITPIDAQSAPAKMRSTHVILVITDGLRWQELFGGADASLMGPAGRVADTTKLRNTFWRDTPVARRSALLPFVWGTMATRGQIFGDSTIGSSSVVTNGLKFSYPGYSEAFTGHADPRIDSNDHAPNENRTVFEWLNTQPALSGRVAAFATWNAFRRIINTERSRVPVYDGWDNAVAPTGTPRAAALREVMATNTRVWPDNTWDAFTHVATLDYITRRKPRVLFIGYGETDEWAHAGRYDLYLQSARQVDGYLAQLWQRAQADPLTRDKTTLIVTTDHGRGQGAKWTDHGKDVTGAERMWIAVMGPDVPALGVRRDTPSTQSQVAATIAAALGFDWRKAEPKAAAALPAFFR
ncbi:MAG: alkaline phosphatase family protein [Gemmatimonas sp.]